MNARVILCALLWACLPAAFPANSTARATGPRTHPQEPERVLVLDGSNVHDVGELFLHVGNRGLFGSMPGSANSYSDAPSAEWPRIGRRYYLWAAGLWVGALKQGVPAVSTVAFAAEFRPTENPIDIMYRAAEGNPGGARGVDDDADGLVDEDRLDGHDNDLDGLVDEDFAAISDQMFSCWYTDDQPIAEIIYPEHNPHHLKVEQESYQWSDDRFDDVVGMEFTITNIGNDVLEDVYVGMFADCDAGGRWRFSGGEDFSGEDDATGHRFDPARCTELGPAAIDVSYTYDADLDEGQSPGYFGVLLLGFTTDPTGQVAPRRMSIATYANFSGNTSFEDGGDPTNDFERYELLSQGTSDFPSIDRDAVIPRDYRMLIGVGPFNALLPDSAVVFQVAFVMGSPFTGMLDNAANAQVLFNGEWFDADGDPSTGVAGRETPVFGPAAGVRVDTCACPGCPPVGVPANDVVWINNDCAQEDLFEALCGYTDADSLVFRTGVGGREHQVHWMIPGAAAVDVQDFSGRPMRSGIELTWNVVSGGDVQGLRIYRGTGGNDPVRLLNTGQLIPPESGAYFDSAVQPGRTYGYALAAVLYDGSEIRSQTIIVSTKASSLELYQSVPNPANPTTTISFVLPEEGRVTLTLYALDGRLVRTLVDETLPAGLREVQWDGRDNRGNVVSSGVYFYRVKAGRQALARKLLYLK